MRAVVQRVSRASVSIEGQVVGSCGHGLAVFLGVGPADGEAEVDKLWTKIFTLRIFADEDGRTNRSLGDIAGEALIVSQFTLYADCRHGRRPSFTGAAAPDAARALYEDFVARARQDAPVSTGRFGADMQVALVNDGPFTICLDTDYWGGAQRA